MKKAEEGGRDSMTEGGADVDVDGGSEGGMSREREEQKKLGRVGRKMEGREEEGVCVRRDQSLTD